MDNFTTNIHTAFEQHLDDIAWPIKCHWAKHFPIRVVTTAKIEIAAMDFEQVFIHLRLGCFDDNVIFCVLAHEWAHRMVSPKSIETGKGIISAVSQTLKIDEQLAQLVSSPAIELIVDRSNCEIEMWNEIYREGITFSFTSFANDLKQKNSNSRQSDDALLEFQKMMLALRIANVSEDPLPAYIRHLEGKARDMISLLFEEWNGCIDNEDLDHIKKIICFSETFYEWLPKALFKQHDMLNQMLEMLLQGLGDLVKTLASIADECASTKGAPSSSGSSQAVENQSNVFDLGLTRQVTDQLMRQAHKPRQITGLWQPGHPFSKLDLKRSARCSPVLIPGITTRRKTDSSRIHQFESGKQIRLCLIVDDSASMSGDEAKFSRSICEGINRFAAIKDMHVGLITFGSDIDVSLQPQRRYHLITRSLTRLDGNLGGTNLLPALERLAYFIESDREITDALLITDASFSDWDNCKAPIAAILEHIHFTVLLINSEIPDEILPALKNHQRAVSFFKLNPSEPTNAAMLKEIIR